MAHEQTYPTQLDDPNVGGVVAEELPVATKDVTVQDDNGVTRKIFNGQQVPRDLIKAYQDS